MALASELEVGLDVVFDVISNSKCNFFFDGTCSFPASVLVSIPAVVLVVILFGIPSVVIFVALVLVLVVGISAALFTYFFKCLSGQGVANTSFDLFECSRAFPFCITLTTVYVEALYLSCNLPPLQEMSFCFSFKTTSPTSIHTGLSFLRS